MKADDVVVFHMDDSESSRVKRRSLYTGDLIYPHGHYKSMHSWHSLTILSTWKHPRERALKSEQLFLIEYIGYLHFLVILVGVIQWHSNRKRHRHYRVTIWGVGIWPLFSQGVYAVEDKKRGTFAVGWRG